MKIMLADDEPSIRMLVKLTVEESGHDFYEASDGKDALRLFKEEHPDLVILDVMMPRMSGLDVCEGIRAIDENVPIILLSAKGDIVDKKNGYKAGADDYITKPFDEEELMLHVSAFLRRTARKADSLGFKQSRQSFSVGDFDFDYNRYEVRVKGVNAGVTLKEFQILSLLAHHVGEAFAQEEIIAQVWGEEYLSENVGLAVYMRHIREKIEENPSKPRYLQTVRRVGYRLEATREAIG